MELLAKRIFIILLVSTIFLLWFPLSTSEADVGVFPLDSEVEGRSYEDWTIEFWKWVYETPATSHPMVDETGQDCSENQGNLPVFFLVFTGSGFAERACDVPTGTPILVPVNVVACTFAELDVQSVEELHTCAEEDESSNPGLFLSIDGSELTQLEDYRVHSTPFALTLPEDSIIGVSGATTGVSDGYWVILRPLSPGQHTVHVKASLSNPVTGILFYQDEWITHLNVVEPQEIGPIVLTGSSPTRNFLVDVLWTPDHIGEANSFELTIMNEEGKQIDNAIYDIMLFRGDQLLDGTHRTSQTGLEQKYTFSDVGSYVLRIENINGNGPSEYVSIPIEVTPEFPIGLFFLLASALGMIIAVGRYRGFLKILGA